MRAPIHIAFTALAALVAALPAPAGTPEPAAAAAEATAPDGARALLEQYLDEVPRWQARFEQILRDANGRLVETSRGMVYIQRPNRFRWDYEAPFPQQIVADGDTLWVYDEDLEQVTARPLGSALETTPAALLGEAFDIDARFSVEELGEAEGMRWLRLQPREADGSYQAVILAFRDGQLARMQLDDSLGNTTVMLFTAEQREPAFPAGWFDFQPPEGADVIRAGEEP